MKKILLFLAVTASLMAWDTGKVVGVIDGDTVLIKLSRAKVVKCRLIGLDTFETGFTSSQKHRAFMQQKFLNQIHPFKKHSIKEVLYWGHKAKEYAIKKVLYKVVQYNLYEKDRYGRPLIYIKDLNYGLIRSGLAVQYTTNLLHVKRKKFLLNASRDANINKRGFYER